MLYHHNLNSACTAGGYDGNSVSTNGVHLYNSEDDEWTTVGQMSTGRNDHAMSLVPGNVRDFCL